MTDKKIRLGLISALHQEQTGLIEQMHGKHCIRRGMRDYTSGSLWGIDCVCVLSRIGKVAAATTAATLIERFNVTHIVFTGVAGSAAQDVHVGDIVLAENLVQHDMDATPLAPRFEVPLTGISAFASDLDLSILVGQAAADFLGLDWISVIETQDKDEFKLKTPRLHRGLIASGDEFITSSAKITALKLALPEVLAVEMEGAAVAQVCFEFGIPFAVIRTISDKANENACIDFNSFLERVAQHYAFNIVKRMCTGLHAKKAFKYVKYD
ncbi:MAG: 5'-methylthioadenosine/adenosylhomocysteine nucleosidase [Glaciimonas sp.]|nr:5'-methylthioadenosine/adenosylhomocysteine nucleosidase [Glaciimonas sp.]